MEDKLQNWKLENGPLFGFGDLQCINFCCYRNGKRISREQFHYTKVAELLNHGEMYELKDEKIEKISVYRNGALQSRTYHAFTVIKTEKYYYSMERRFEYVSIYRSNVMEDVVDAKRGGIVCRETDWAEGKGTVWDVINLILKKRVLVKKFNILFRNCQVFSALIFKNFNTEGLKLKKYQKSLAGFPLRRAAGYVNLKYFTMFS